MKLVRFGRCPGAALSLLLALTVAAPTQTAARLTVLHPGTPAATLMHDGTPMFKVGPVPEQAPFALRLGDNPTFDHVAWFDWMQQHRLEYGRVYPDNGFPRLFGPTSGPVAADAPGRVFPFEIVRWQEGRPIADLRRFDAGYWTNMSRVIREADRRGIVLQLQLYQRAYFASRDNGWAMNFFNPANNVNGYPVAAARGRGAALDGEATATTASGYEVIEAMALDTPWRDVHRRWVRHILDAIGDSGNVIIDLMNEGSFGQGISRRWIESTLDIIDDWEAASGEQILVGMDFDHFYKEYRRAGNCGELDYVLAHPRLDVLIAEGAESHVVPSLAAGDREPMGEDLARRFRARYGKPMVSTNSPSYGPHERLEALHLYQWYSLLSKVQGVGVYGKRYPLSAETAAVSEYARRSRILMTFFDAVADYAALEPVRDENLQAHGAHRLALASPREAIVYLHAGIGSPPIEAGTSLTLAGLDIADGDATVESLDPRSGTVQRWQSRFRHGTLTTTLPSGAADIALRIYPSPHGSDPGAAGAATQPAVRANLKPVRLPAEGHEG